MVGLLELLFVLTVWLLLLGLFLVALFFIVRAAVEGGVRRALRDDLLRPSVRELLAAPGPHSGPRWQDGGQE